MLPGMSLTWALAEPSRPAPRPQPAHSSFYIPGLDGIRACAFLMVFLAHALRGAVARFVPATLGITVFFFLSGYLITTLLRRERALTGSVSLRDFYLRRALRILAPLYVVYALAAAVARFALHDSAGNGLGLLSVFFQCYNYTGQLLGHAQTPDGMTVLWSLAIEEHFYLLFPVAYLLLRALAPRRHVARVHRLLPRRARLARRRGRFLHAAPRLGQPSSSRCTSSISTPTSPTTPPGVDWSKYTDEGWYGDAAIRHYLFGHWYFKGDFNPAVALPVWPALELALFRFTGVSAVAARALTLGVFAVTLVALYRLIARHTHPRTDHSGPAAGRAAHRLPALRQPVPLSSSSAWPSSSRCSSPHRPGAPRRLAPAPIPFAVIEPQIRVPRSLALFMQRKLKTHPLPTIPHALALLLPRWSSPRPPPSSSSRPSATWSGRAPATASAPRCAGRAARAHGAGPLAGVLLPLRPPALSGRLPLPLLRQRLHRHRARALYSVVLNTLGDGAWMGQVLYPPLRRARAALFWRPRLLTNPLIPALLLWIGGYFAFLAYHNNLQPRYYLVVAVPITAFVALAIDGLRQPRRVPARPRTWGPGSSAIPSPPRRPRHRRARRHPATRLHPAPHLRLPQRRRSRSPRSSAPTPRTAT
jgi:peptidoglycan/LPS O-acetylase OafA/YrhL